MTMERRKDGGREDASLSVTFLSALKERSTYFNWIFPPMHMIANYGKIINAERFWKKCGP